MTTSSTRSGGCRSPEALRLMTYPTERSVVEQAERLLDRSAPAAAADRRTGPMTLAAAPRRSPLDATHRALGARLITFAGYEMPVRYSSELEEHRAVRTAVGLFDLSHMGEIGLRGTGALAFARRVLVSDPARARARAGAVLDGLRRRRRSHRRRHRLSARRSRTSWSATPRTARRCWTTCSEVAAAGNDEVSIDDESDATALVAPQGPRAAELLAGLTDVDLATLRNYRSVSGTVAGVACLVARTGYTGEDGFELFCAAGDAVQMWDAVAAAGAPLGLLPCGLASRDTLRLEAGMPLYGNELGPRREPVRGQPGPRRQARQGRLRGSGGAGRGRAGRAASSTRRPRSCVTRGSRVMATRS